MHHRSTAATSQWTTAATRSELHPHAFWCTLSPQPPLMPQKEASRTQCKPQLLIVAGGLQEGQQAEGGNPWGNLQTGGQVDWSIRPKAASLAAADKPSSRSASPAPSTVSARSLPNLNVPEAGPKAPSQDGQSSPRGDPLAGMSSAEIQRHMARQAMVAAREEAGTLSDKSSTSHDSPVGSLADSAGGGPGLGDKPARQAASEPSIEEADQVSLPPLAASLLPWHGPLLLGSLNPSAGSCMDTASSGPAPESSKRWAVCAL